MSKKNKGVNLINSRTPAEAREHRREVLAAVHECKVRGFSHPESVDALRQQFQVTRDMARQYIVWYNDERRGKRYVDFDLKRQLVWERYENLFGKAHELAEVSGDYKQAIDINDKMDKFLEREEKRFALMQPAALVEQTHVPLADRTPEERAILRRLIEIHLDRQNTSATLHITQGAQTVAAEAQATENTP